MSDRQIDPTRQGITVTHKDEPLPDMGFQAEPISLEEAIATVDGWGEGFGPFGLHQLAIALRRHIARLLDRLVDTEQARDEHRADYIRVHHLKCDALDRILVIEAQAKEDAARLGTLRRENESLRYRAAQSGIALVDQPDIYGSPIEHYPLSRVLDLMDAWRPEVERWGLHQMCRVLRETADIAHGAAALSEDQRADLQRTFDLQWKADQRAIKRWQEAHPGNDLVWPDRADMVVWLLDMLALREADAKGWYRGWRRLGAERTRVLAAIPCSAGKDNCHAPFYRFSTCCNLRVALWPGEVFETDYLPDSREVHLFAPAEGNAPRKSAGCVKLVEPTDAMRLMDERERRLCEEITHAADAEIAALLVEPALTERNETLDWDFKR